MRLNNSRLNQSSTLNKKRFTVVNKALMSLGVLATLASSVAFMPSVHAQNSPNGRDPHDTGCDKNAATLTSTSGRTFGGFGSFGQREIKIYLMKSDACKANWVRADVPKDSRLYLRTENPKKDYVEYKAKVNGVNYTDMWDSRLPFKACADIPGKGTVCTSVVP